MCRIPSGIIYRSVKCSSRCNGRLGNRVKVATGPLILRFWAVVVLYRNENFLQKNNFLLNHLQNDPVMNPLQIILKPA